MPIDVDEVRKIARLACLSIETSQLENYASSLSSILGLVAQMNNVDTTGVTPMSHPFEVNQRLREDKVTETDRLDDFMAIAPATEDGLYLVPKVIE